MKPYKEKIIEKSAGIFKRLLAFLVDILLLNFIIIVPFSNVLTNESISLVQTDVLSSSLYFVLIYLSFAALVYFVLMEYYYKKTVGMKLLKIEGSGEMTLLRIVARHMYLIPFFPFSLLLFMDPIWLIFKGERLSERWTKTRTVEIVRSIN